LTITALFGTGALSAQEAKPVSEKQWKDGRAEWNLYDAMTKASDPKKKLELLNTWKEKYAGTDFKLLRLQAFLATYWTLNQPAQVVATSKEILTIDPKDIRALNSICFLTPRLPNPNEETFATGEKAARGLLANLDAAFAAASKPETTSAADWSKAKSDTEVVARKALGWVSMQRKNNERAEAEFRKGLAINSNDGEVSYWMGTVMVAQKVPQKQSEALYHFARASSYDGPGALNPQGRQEVNKYLEKAYTSIHGSTEGLDDIRAMAKSQALPPPGFKVKTAAQVAIEKEEQFKREHPMLALFQSIKKELTGPNGDAYWESGVKHAGLPGGASGVEKFCGKLISHKPTRNPKELVLGISDETTPEVTLSLDAAMRGPAEPGTEICFEGIATEFTKEPFTITFEVEKSKVEGWPAPPARRRRR
jgi:tetratricopeptide (TPR) repeat protein